MQRNTQSLHSAYEKSPRLLQSSSMQRFELELVMAGIDLLPFTLRTQAGGSLAM